MKSVIRKWLPSLVWAIMVNLLFFSGFALLSLKRDNVVPDRPKARAVALSRPASFAVPASRPSPSEKPKTPPQKTRPKQEKKTEKAEPPDKPREPEPEAGEQIKPPPDLSALNREPEAKAAPPPPAREKDRAKPEPEPEPDPKPEPEPDPKPEPEPDPEPEPVEKKVEQPPPEKPLEAMKRAARMVPSMSSTAQIQKASAGQVDKSPRLIDRVPPRYPDKAWKKGLTGSVVVRMLIDARGCVAQISILRSDPPGVFENSVKEAVRQWKFRPGEFRKKPVPVWVVQRIHFRLPD